MQLHLAGESLMGWMAWDLMRGVDVLLDHGRRDPDASSCSAPWPAGGDPAA